MSGLVIWVPAIFRAKLLAIRTRLHQEIKRALRAKVFKARIQAKSLPIAEALTVSPLLLCATIPTFAGPQGRRNLQA